MAEQFEEPERSNESWANREMECAICDRQWIATYQVGTPALECPGCGYFNAVESSPSL